jgi:hypothetical protein
MRQFSPSQHYKFLMISGNVGPGSIHSKAMVGVVWKFEVSYSGGLGDFHI